MNDQTAANRLVKSCTQQQRGFVAGYFPDLNPQGSVSCDGLQGDDIVRAVAHIRIMLEVALSQLSTASGVPLSELEAIVGKLMVAYGSEAEINGRITGPRPTGGGS